MTAHKKWTWLVAGMLFCTSARVSFGQLGDWVDTPAHDLQFYSPVNFDFDGRPVGRDCGYFFRFDKLSWAATGEQVGVGNPDVQVMSEIIIPDALAESFSATSGPLSR